MVDLLAARGPIWIQVTAPAGFAPKKVAVDIHIDPTDDDRMVYLYAFEGGLAATSSEIPLSFGSQSQRTHHWVWKALWPGEFIIVAQIGRTATSIRATATERLFIPE